MKIVARLIELLIFTFLLTVTLYLGLAVAPPRPMQPGSPQIAQVAISQPLFPSNPLIAPADGATISTQEPTFDWADASDSAGNIISYTLVITGPAGQETTTSLTTTHSIYTPTTSLTNGSYTWTVQAHNETGGVSGYVAPPAVFTITIEANWQLYLPIIIMMPSCPTSSNATFNLIPISGPAADHPDYLHGDLNLNLRGYAPTTAFLGLVDYSGGTDANAPQLAGLFGPNRFPGVSAVYQVNSWNWGCGVHGCPGPTITNPPVTLAGLRATPGEPIHIPERGPSIYPGNYKAMVLYAEAQRLTLGYTRQDTVATGYAVHLENICVDPNLLALYRAQTDNAGWHVTGQLPAVDNNQAVGTAMSSEIQVVIRDRGTFMDPRSRKDWWQGY